MVNTRRLKIFEARDVAFGVDDMPLKPLEDSAGVQRWEIPCIVRHRLHKQRQEMYVEWAEYDQSWGTWVHRDSLLEDVPALVAAYDASPTVFQARKSAPKRATKGRQSLPQVAEPSRRLSARLQGVHVETVSECGLTNEKDGAAPHHSVSIGDQAAEERRQQQADAKWAETEGASLQGMATATEQMGVSLMGLAEARLDTTLRGTEQKETIRRSRL